MFNFRLINTPDGNQIIDTTLKTPYDSITPIEMLEYMEVDARLAYMERMERKQKREVERKQKFSYRFMHKVACMCGIVLQNVYFIGGIKMNEDIKKSLDRIRESVEKMCHIAWNDKLEKEYTNILEEVEKIEKISK